jgi:hypothetical protein
VTRRLPPEVLSGQAAASGQHRWLADARRSLFAAARPWEEPAAMAAVHWLRPDLGVDPDLEAHQVHMFRFPRDAAYFGRVCQLFKLYGIGNHWGES